MSSGAEKRFDIVVLNFQRLHSFASNLDKLPGFDPKRDRITIVSCSPSPDETNAIKTLERDLGSDIRYLTRENRGIDQLARAEYFLGRVGSREENLEYAYILQFQDHYLDTDADYSRWGADHGYRIKGDVIPDASAIDLDELYQTLSSHELDGAFCDRNDPCWFVVGKRSFVAPSGGNFAISTDRVREPLTQRTIRKLIRTCDGSYDWAVFAEFLWGEIFFQAGRPFYDIKRKRIFRSWPQQDFYEAPDDYPSLRNRYWSKAAGARQRLRRVKSRGRRRMRSIRDRVVTSPSARPIRRAGTKLRLWKDAVRSSRTGNYSPYSLSQLFELILLESDKERLKFVEIGVFKGDNAIHLHHHMKSWGAEFDYVGFDLFDDVDGFYSQHADERSIYESDDYPYWEFKSGAHKLAAVSDKLAPLLANGGVLIPGDSTSTVPASVDSTRDADLVYIDGCHEYDVVSKDWANIRDLLHGNVNAVVVFDDVSETDAGRVVEEIARADTCYDAFRLNSNQAVALHVDAPTNIRRRITSILPAVTGGWLEGQAAKA